MEKLEDEARDFSFKINAAERAREEEAHQVSEALCYA